MSTEGEPSDGRGDVVELVCQSGVHIGTTVVYAVSEVAGTPVDELASDLSDYVDPDALEQLFADRLDGSPRIDGRLSFFMLGCEVTVTADGRVLARPASERPSRTVERERFEHRE